MIQAFNEDRYNSLKEIQEKAGNQEEALKEETKKVPQRNTGKYNQIGEGIEQKCPKSKNQNRDTTQRPYEAQE